MEHGRNWSWPNRGTNINLYGGTEEMHGRTEDMLGRRQNSNRSPAEQKFLSVCFRPQKKTMSKTIFV
jgi:hypothetical protein